MPDLPAVVILAINKNGVTVIDTKTKVLCFMCCTISLLYNTLSYSTVCSVRNGLSHLTSQEILATYAFKVITNWASGQNWFHMTIGSNLVGGSKLVCETPLVSAAARSVFASLIRHTDKSYFQDAHLV